MVLVVVSLLVPVAERFRLPHTVLLAIDRNRSIEKEFDKLDMSRNTYFK